MGIIDKLLGSDEVIKKGSEILDESLFSQEERAQHFKGLLKLYEPFRVAQRFIALLVVCPFVLVYLLSVTMFILSAFIDVGSIETVKTIADNNTATLGQAASIIVAFYFGGGMLEGAIRTWNDKKEKR